MSVDRAVVRRGITDALPLFVPAIPFALVIGLAITESGINVFAGWSGSTAFLLHDVQSHRHHLEVLRAARPGWEHTGNACHLRLDVQTVRLEHLWLPGHACEIPTGEFGGILYEYERLLTL